MKKISDDIIENGININNANRERNTVRAVIKKNNYVFMLYSKLYNDYTFPGGGIKEDEDHIDSLKRELLEEVGATKINVVDKIGYIVEYRYGINSSNNIYKQTSYYYLVEILEQNKPSYVGREKMQGLEMKWVLIDDVIKHNELINNKRDKNANKGFQTVLIRENEILKHLRGI